MSSQVNTKLEVYRNRWNIYKNVTKSSKGSYQQTSNMTQWPTNWKRSIYMPMPKEGDWAECANYCTISLNSHAKKLMFRIIQYRLEPSMKREIFGFRKGLRISDIVDACWIIDKTEEYQKKVSMCFVDYKTSIDCITRL